MLSSTLRNMLQRSSNVLERDLPTCELITARNWLMQMSKSSAQKRVSLLRQLPLLTFPEWHCGMLQPHTARTCASNASHKGLLLFLWDEAVSHAVYIHN